MNIISFKDCNIYKNLSQIDENGRKIDLYKFENCVFTGLNLYYPNTLIKFENELALPTLERTMSLKSGTIYEKFNMKFHYSEKDCKNICNIPLFFFIYSILNYFLRKRRSIVELL